MGVDLRTPSGAVLRGLPGRRADHAGTVSRPDGRSAGADGRHPARSSPTHRGQSEQNIRKRRPAASAPGVRRRAEGSGDGTKQRDVRTSAPRQTRPPAETGVPDGGGEEATRRRGGAGDREARPQREDQVPSRRRSRGSQQPPRLSDLGQAIASCPPAEHSQLPPAAFHFSSEPLCSYPKPRLLCHGHAPSALSLLLLPDSPRAAGSPAASSTSRQRFPPDLPQRQEDSSPSPSEGVG